MDFDTRVGAYGVIVRDGAILLARWTDSGVPRWTLPGGGLELGEDAPSAAVREIAEETGYTAELDGLLGVDSKFIPAERRLHGRGRPLHALRIIYAATIIGGELTHETAGSTDQACWFGLDEVPALDRVDLVDAGLRLYSPQQA
ncbi:MutT/NUDIX family phosphohydrolase [Arthrobacter crystallopoietes BAB-32]|uniref:MutT/NUDIX family phosphohydrolase n=1 Tax=Arthrobacter crystallopoietes BAB-32 TaxID=1246476 RepID=N1V5U5_9MICC|nr:NUDIX hydrolase [Arthrobacter crystallopoietes]EMY35467.1 MutT/NUDIX family phosphohydrolase [Arthrobacter crystallopoietes BAB-32]